MYEKDKSNINSSVQCIYISVFYLVSTLQKKVIWTPTVSHFYTKPEEGNGGSGNRKIVIAERAGRSPKDGEARDVIF